MPFYIRPLPQFGLIIASAGLWHQECYAMALWMFLIFIFSISKSTR